MCDVWPLVGLSTGFVRFGTLRQQLADRKAVQILVVDLERPLVRRLLAANVLADDSMRAFLDTIPANTRSYINEIRAAMVAAHQQQHATTVALYSIKDDTIDVYSFWDE